MTVSIITDIADGDVRMPERSRGPVRNAGL